MVLLIAFSYYTAVGVEDKVSTPTYLINYTNSSDVDWRLSQTEWEKASWSSDYVWIDAGDPAPERARFKALYNNDGLYFLFEFETEKLGPQPLDAGFLHSCEIFLDPEGTGKWYLEYAVSSDGVEHSQVWNGHLSVREFKAEKSPKTIAHATHVPTTEGREVVRYEVTLPWSGMAPLTRKRALPPKRGEAWRANFSRVEPRADYSWSCANFYYMHNPNAFGWLVFAGETNPIEEITDGMLHPKPYVLPGKPNPHFKLLTPKYWVNQPLMPLPDGGYYGVNKCSVSKFDREGKTVWTVTRKDGLSQFARSCAVVGDKLWLYGNGMQPEMPSGVYCVSADAFVRKLAGSEWTVTKVYSLGAGRFAAVGGDRFRIVTDGVPGPEIQASGSVNFVAAFGDRAVVGTSEGFDQFDMDGKLLHQAKVGGGITSAVVCMDSVVGVSGKTGLFKIDSDGVCAYFPKPLAIPFNGIYADGDKIWATYVGGMALVDAIGVRWFDEPLGNAGFQVVSAAKSSCGTMVFLCSAPHGNWYTSSLTSSYLLTYDGKRWKRYTYRNGLPAFTSAINSINGRVFLTTQAGFYEFMP